MTFGLNTFLFESPFTDKTFYLVKKFKDWGFDSIEIALEDSDHINPRSLKKVLDDQGMMCGTMCTALGPDRDLRGTAEQQRTCIDYLKRLMDIMTEIGSPVLMGPLYSSVGRAEPRDENEYKRQWDIVVKNLQAIADYAGQRNLRLAIEPLNRYETDFINTCAQAMKLVNDIGHDAAGLLLDTYHMNIEEKNSAAAIRDAGNRLYHFHACGCDRGTPGNDHIDWKNIAQALKDVNYNKGVVIESFTTDVKVIAKAASIWRDFEPSKDDIAIKGLSFLKNILDHHQQ
jgi:D-psicose/D-tagatose/L-ribulose 3-epimerase